MKKLFLFTVFFSLATSISIAQKNHTPLELYNMGNVAFAKKDYKTADSLYTLSLKFEKHKDTYFNRAACRQKLNDFKGYCIDLGSAANLGDYEASKLYRNECVKEDTVFTGVGNSPASIKDFQSAEFYKNYVYLNNLDYEKYDNTKTRLLAYETIGIDTIYKDSKEVNFPDYEGGIDSLSQFILKNTKSLKDLDKKTIFGANYLTFIIDKNGALKNFKITYAANPIIANEVLETISKSGPWKPASYNNSFIKFRKTIAVNFSGNKVSITNVVAPLKRLDEVYTIVETMPEFPGGPMEMMKFIQTNIRYPANARENGISGHCYLKFIIEKDGSIHDIVVLKGVAGCPACDDEAMRVVGIMPKWKPGTQNGIPVPVFFNLPINFIIKSGK